MGRLIVLILLAVVAVWLIRRALRAGRRTGFENRSPIQGDLVRCAHCGTHLPRSEARPGGELLYCSEEHARLGPAKR